MRKSRGLFVLNRPPYQFAEPPTTLSVENIFDAVGVLTHKRVKLLSQQIPFIEIAIIGHNFARRPSKRGLFIGGQCRNWPSMSERMRCVVARPKTENTSAMALAVTTKTTMSWSVKSTVSMMRTSQSVSSEGPSATAPLHAICDI